MRRRKHLYNRQCRLCNALTGGATALIGDVVYVAGGQSGQAGSATKYFWRFDLAAEDGQWEKLPPWPGPERAFQQMVAQHNGREMCLYLFGGRRRDTEVEGIEGIVPLSDVYEFSPHGTGVLVRRDETDTVAQADHGRYGSGGRTIAFFCSGLCGWRRYQKNSE